MIVALNGMGISPGDSLDIIDSYPDHEVNWFVREIAKQFHRKRVSNDMTLVNHLIIAKDAGTKKGNSYYAKWRRDKIDEMEKLDAEDTVFDRLKQGAVDNTVFGKLKRFSGR